MRFVLQRVKHASVKVDGELIGSIGRGYMVLMGVSDTDTEEITDKMVDKMCKLRIFEDENGKTNLGFSIKLAKELPHFFLLLKQLLRKACIIHSISTVLDSCFNGSR